MEGAFVEFCQQLGTHTSHSVRRIWVLGPTAGAVWGGMGWVGADGLERVEGRGEAR